MVHNDETYFDDDTNRDSDDTKSDDDNTFDTADSGDLDDDGRIQWTDPVMNPMNALYMPMRELFVF